MHFSFPREAPPLPDPLGPRGVPHRPPRARSRARRAGGRTSLWNPPRAHRPQASTYSNPASKPRPLRRRRDSPGTAHVAGRAPRHVRREAGPRSRQSQEFGLISPPRSPAPPPHAQPVTLSPRNTLPTTPAEALHLTTH